MNESNVSNSDPYIETVSGRHVHFLDPDPDTIFIGDIAHALSRICRYTGHVRDFYSVAEHSWNASRYLHQLSKEIQLAALMHDATEAYLNDIASPIKGQLPDYKRIEDNLMSIISYKFGINEIDHEAVKYADKAMLSIESHYLLQSHGNEWPLWKQISRPKVDPTFKPICMSPEQARMLFLERFYELTE